MFCTISPGCLPAIGRNTSERKNRATECKTLIQHIPPAAAGTQVLGSSKHKLKLLPERMIFVLLFWFSVVFRGWGGSARGARSKKGHSSSHNRIRKLSFCSLSLEPSFAFFCRTCFSLCHWEGAPPSSPSATETHRSVQEGRARGLAAQGSCRHSYHPASRAKSQSSLQIFFDATFHSLPHLLKAAFQLSGVAATAC